MNWNAVFIARDVWADSLFEVDVGIARCESVLQVSPVFVSCTELSASLLFSIGGFNTNFRATVRGN